MLGYFLAVWQSKLAQAFHTAAACQANVPRTLDNTLITPSYYMLPAEALLKWTDFWLSKVPMMMQTLPVGH